MLDLRKAVEGYSDSKFETVFIRFPNSNRIPLNKCPAGDIMYIFTNGDIAYCPYMVFAAKNSSGIYDYQHFVMGNIFRAIPHNYFRLIAPRIFRQIVQK